MLGLNRMGDEGRSWTVICALQRAIGTAGFTRWFATPVQSRERGGLVLGVGSCHQFQDKIGPFSASFLDDALLSPAPPLSLPRPLHTRAFAICGRQVAGVFGPAMDRRWQVRHNEGQHELGTTRIATRPDWSTGRLVECSLSHSAFRLVPQLSLTRKPQARQGRPLGPSRQRRAGSWGLIAHRDAGIPSPAPAAVVLLAEPPPWTPELEASRTPPRTNPSRPPSSAFWGPMSGGDGRVH